MIKQISDKRASKEECRMEEVAMFDGLRQFRVVVDQIWDRGVMKKRLR